MTARNMLTMIDERPRRRPTGPFATGVTTATDGSRRTRLTIADGSTLLSVEASGRGTPEAAYVAHAHRLPRPSLRTGWFRLAVFAGSLANRRALVRPVGRSRIGRRAGAGLVVARDGTIGRMARFTRGRRGGHPGTVGGRRSGRRAHRLLRKDPPTDRPTSCQRPSRSESPGIARSARSLRRCQASRVACLACSHSNFELPREVLQSRLNSGSTSSKGRPG